ncbi:MAG: D-alanyl-D-alanine carboxypeptidase/D-alanyl-D-alanine-endopeptidase [Elusimicrobiales bacterium]
MKILVFSALLLAAPCAYSAGIDGTIKRLAAAPGVANASWGLSVKDLSGKTLAQRNPRLNLTPASILKVFVAAAALEKFGPEKTFKTGLYYDGSISNGFLNGNLYIRGGGDPSLGSALIKDARPLEEVFADWTAAVKAAGIRVINGAVAGDDSAFEKWQPGSWAWEDIGNYYAAQPSALTVNDGAYRIVFKPSEQVGGEAALLRTEPLVEGLEFDNYMRTGPKGSGDNGYVYAFPGQRRAVLRGAIPQGQPEFAIKAALPDPALFAAQSFGGYLTRAGVNANKKPFRGSPEKEGKLTLVTETESGPLKDAVRVTNKRSFNLYAELLLRHLGGGKPAAGASAVSNFLATAGADVSELKMADACGLSWRNMTKAETFTDMLRYVHGRKYFPEFYDSLVYPGDPDATGHARNLGKGTPLERNLRLKSGSLNGVRAYTGYLKTKKGKTLVFTSILNNYSMNGGAADKMHEELLLALYESY